MKLFLEVRVPERGYSHGRDWIGTPSQLSSAVIFGGNVTSMGECDDILPTGKAAL